MNNHRSEDFRTAQAFTNSWQNLPKGSVYSREQFEEWFDPVKESDVRGKRVLELGCGNGSLLVHLLEWKPAYVEGIDLGDSVISATQNLERMATKNWKITKADLTEFESDGFDLVYCIGVLHHLENPLRGFEAVVRNVKAGGRFHCSVYAEEGNGLIIAFVEPLRKIFSKFPWWFTKYCVATPMVIPFYLYTKFLQIMPKFKLLSKLPLFNYSLWIAKRDFSFFRHVAFDQLVTPHTIYFSKKSVENLLQGNPMIDQSSTYIIFRNGNSWKFGGKTKSESDY